MALSDRMLDALAKALWRISDDLWADPLTHRLAHWLGRKSLLIRDRNEEWTKIDAKFEEERRGSIG